MQKNIRITETDQERLDRLKDAGVEVTESDLFKKGLKVLEYCHVNKIPVPV
jgi:hypothetical protein